MPTRLEPLNLVDFTGGLNLKRNQFQLAENESPDMLNVDIDPRGGFCTRRGWQRWNPVDIVDPTTVPWAPRNAATHIHSDGTETVYVVNEDKIYYAPPSATFTQLPTISVGAVPHGADFAPWGDDLYISTGYTSNTYRRNVNGDLVMMTRNTWSEVELPTSNTVPPCDYVEAHAGYLFIAHTEEAGNPYRARLRWSHPGKPDAFRESDYLDIEQGGGAITGLLSFRDHLLIFKTNSLWALYGYDDDSWQLIKVSTSIGCPAVTAISRSETAAYFYSSSERGGIYAYSGDAPIYLSERLRPAFEELIAYRKVFVSWAGRRLWVGVPWVKGIGPTSDVSTCLVLDLDIGDGAWVMYRSEHGAIGPVLDGSDFNAKYPLAAFWSEQCAALVILDYIDDAFDTLFSTPLIGQSFDSYYRTRWLHAGWPDRKKSWRRPTFICRQVTRDTELLVETFRDYNESTIHRTRTLYVPAYGSAYWTANGYADALNGGFDWSEAGLTVPPGPGANWSAQKAGSNLMRAGSMGLARSVQMRVRASPNTPLRRWGIDGIVAKYVNRRFR